MKPVLIAGASILIAACAPQLPPAASRGDPALDSAARDYVALQLAIGEKEKGYIDAYYGPAELKQRGVQLAQGRDAAQLRSDVQALSARIAALPADRGTDRFERVRFLIANLKAADTRLRMLGGERLSFVEEAQGLFSVTPEPAPLEQYDPILERIEALVPGDGPLWKRVDSFQDRFTIPTERLKPVFDAAIAECRTRTARHIALPPGERFDMGFVTGKSWSGYNYYQGGYVSRIEINTDLPIRISRAVDLGCHEGYPGHHALNALIEQRLVNQRGWVEYSVYPLYSPQSLIAEGTANYGIDLAFPGPEKLGFEVRALYPLAGLPTADAARYDRLLKALDQLQGARLTIAAGQVDGRLSEEQAIALTQKYLLVSTERARQMVKFTSEYRSYVLNYGLGKAMVRADVESRATPTARWKRFEAIISRPTLPADLKPLGR